jgi:hypothetical protein
LEKIPFAKKINWYRSEAFFSVKRVSEARLGERGAGKAIGIFEKWLR